MEPNTADRDAEGLDAGRVVSALAGWACGGCGVRDVAQAGWASVPVRERLRVLREARRRMAASAERFAEAMSPALPRTGADTITAELMPLLDACKFLERRAGRVLAPQRLRAWGRPFWLRGVAAEIHREALGEVLVIGPGNFPLFLPGVQVLQALAAGNSVVWKPAPGGGAVAELVRGALEAAGLPRGLLRVTEDSAEAARVEIARGPAKVVFTGSHETGCAVLRELARTATPAVMELSGADAVVVLPGADLPRVAKAVAFGLRLNGGQVCMSPRRLFAEREMMARLVPLLERELADVPAVSLAEKTASLLRELVDEARKMGAEVADFSSYGSSGATDEMRGSFPFTSFRVRMTTSNTIEESMQRPLLVKNARVEMRVARSDVFAPVISLIELTSLALLPEAYAACDYALTVAVFCGRSEEAQARTIGMSLKAGTVLVNDLIAPTADPRVPFGGRGASGFGVTRGAEGLLEMTAPKVLLMRRGGTMRHLDETSEADVPLLASLVRVVHAGSWGERFAALKSVAKLGRARNRS